MIRPSSRSPRPTHGASLVLATAIAIVAAGPACLKSTAGDGSAPPAAVPAGSAVHRGEFRRELLLTGELEAVRSIAIKAPQTAIFQMRIQFMAEEGSVVREGEPLLSFDNSALAAQALDLENQILDAETQIVAKRSELASALKDLEIELAQRQYEHDRTKLDASVDPEVLSRKELGERQLAYSKADNELSEIKDRTALTRDRGQAELDVLVINRDKLQKDLLSAQRGLDVLTIKAPAEGLVVYETREGTTLHYQEGDSCWPGQGVMRLPDLSEMQVAFQVNEVDAPLLHTGMPVRLAVDAFPGREVAGEIRQIPSMAVKRSEESKIAIFKVIASVAETWVGEMKPGMSVLGRVVVEEHADAPMVARTAVEFDGASYWLREASGSGDAKRREIHPLTRNATDYLISENEHAQLSGRAAQEGG